MTTDTSNAALNALSAWPWLANPATHRVNDGKIKPYTPDYGRKYMKYQPFWA